MPVKVLVVRPGAGESGRRKFVVSRKESWVVGEQRNFVAPPGGSAAVSAVSGRGRRSDSEPVLRCGGALVVHDGPRRLIWERVGVARWTPRRLWPDDAEAAVVSEWVSRGDPVLIILDRRPELVYALVEELAGAPPEITDLITSVAGDVAELRIPPLTWLPDHLAERGQRFLRDVSAAVAHAPTLLLPALILQPHDTPLDGVRFGLRVRQAGWSIDELMAVVDCMAATRRRAA